MDTSDSAYTSIIYNDNLVVTEEQFHSQITQSNDLSESENQNTYIADKSELEKILHTVSILSSSNDCDDDFIDDEPRINTERKRSCKLGKILHTVSILSSSSDCDDDFIDDEPRINTKRKLSCGSSMSSDDDEIKIIDVVIGPNNHQQNNFNVMSPTRKYSNSSENLPAADSLNVIKNEICGMNIEVTSGEDFKNDFCQVPAVLNRDSASDECMSVCSSEIDSVTVSNTPIESDIHHNCPEKCVVKNEIETIDIKENEILSDSDMCNEIVDLTTETADCCTYDVEYDFSHVPTQITGCWKEFNASKGNNFTRGCKWAPDGSCILTCSDDNKLRIFNLPPQLWDSSQWCDISELEMALMIPEGDLIYDYCWYPLMSSTDASTCCLISTSRKSTVHMWDGYTGELRCSYRSFNHLDELVTPHSLSFDSDGEKIFCGFQNVIRVFDVNRPGRLFEERRTYACKSGQCGIISCFAFTSADKNVSAAGSYKSTIGLYSEPYGELSCLLEGQANGITQLKFSPDGQCLYSGGRKDPEILCWDLRNLGTVLFSLRRSVETNQRIYFDISKCGKYVVSGNQNGVITFWDVTAEPKVLNENDFPVLVPTQFFLAHDDCVNGISFHPSYPFLCSSSGQRKFPVLIDDESDEIFSPEVEKQDNSLRLWWIGKLNK